MPERIRTFIAIDVPSEPFREVLDDLRDIGRPVKPVAEPLHLTLKFLGETEVASTARLSRQISEVTAAHGALELDFRGLGAFPRIERPSVVWAGLANGESITALADDLESQLEPLGYPRESRHFHPHVTLARVKGRPSQQLREMLELYADEAFGVAGVSEVRFYQSQLTPAGPEYSVLSTAVLSGED
jgi:2'-5' RNA ligase